jgi:serine protease Do
MFKRLIAALLLIMIVVLSLSMGACSQVTVPSQTPTPSGGQNFSTTPLDPTWTPPSNMEQPILPSITEVVAKVKPSVVAINVKVMTYDVFNRPTQAEGAGSGWVIDKDGYIVTNNHVVEGADSVTVTLSNGSKFSAEDVKTDPLTDLAVVKIDAHNLPALDIGDSSKLGIGDWVVAVGNALGMGISATSGIVSALDVSLSESADQTLHGLIQTDAAINPGNSGGPLINMSGEVIGIDSIKIAQVGVEGMGYAISINEATPIIRELINTGYVVRPWLGIGLATVNQMVASFYNLAVDTGVLVTQVTSSSPAEQAGLKAGDVITAIDGKEVSNAGDLVQLINSYDVGQKVEITFWRDQTENSGSLILGESPPPS